MIKNAIEVMDKQCTANAALIREAVEGMEEQVACQVVAAIERLRFELTTCPRLGERCGVLFGRGGGGGSGRESIFFIQLLMGARTVHDSCWARSELYWAT